MDTPLVVAYALIVIGFLLLVAELFIPSGGLLFVLAVVAIGFGVAMTFFTSRDPAAGFLTLTVVAIALPVTVGLLFHYWPKTPFGKRFFLSTPEEDATVATMPVNLELEQLRGRYGRTVTPLRPAGITEFDGRRVDTITEGLPVEPGQWVRCIDVKAGKVVVRPSDGPKVTDLENIDLG